MKTNDNDIYVEHRCQTKFSNPDHSVEVPFLLAIRPFLSIIIVIHLLSFPVSIPIRPSVHPFKTAPQNASHPYSPDHTRPTPL